MFSFKIKVFWRTMDRQGPKYEPFVDEDILYFDKPIFESEINREVRRVYGFFVDRIEIYPTQHAPDVMPVGKSENN